jgi:pyruvate formate lyase activating enzyme
LIGRDWFDLTRWRLDEDGYCMDCGTPLPGVFELRPGSWGRQRQPVRLQQ